MTDFLSPQETQSVQPGQVVVNVGQDIWKTWNNASSLTGATVGMALTMANPGGPFTVVTLGRFPYTAFNLGAGNSSTVVAGRTPARSQTGQAIGTCDTSGEIFLLPTTIGTAPPTSTVQTVPNVAALRATAPNSSNAVTLLAYSTTGDAGGGQMIWSSTDTRADNSCTVFAVTGISTGRWNRLIDDHLTTAQCGVFPGTDVTTSFHNADTVATAASLTLVMLGGTYTLSSDTTITSTLSPEPGAIFSTLNTITHQGILNIPSLQQLYLPGTSVRFTIGSTTEIWPNWWGVSPSQTSANNRAGIISALNSWQAALQTASNTLSGSAPKLRLGPGNHQVSPSAATQSPIFNIKNVVGGVWEGSGKGQSCISCVGVTNTWNVSSPAAVIRLTNCQNVELRDFDVLNSSSGMAEDITSDVSGWSAGGSANTVTVGSVSGIGSFPIPVTLYKFPGHYEQVNATGIVSGTTLQLDRVVRFTYSGNNADGTINKLVHAPVAAIDMYSDVTDPGFVAASTGNKLSHMYLGGKAITTSLYGVSITCNGGSNSSSDVNNDEHMFTDVETQLGPPVIGGLLIGHLNAISIKTVGGVMGGGQSFYAVHIPNGGTLNSHGTEFIGTWAVCAYAGVYSHGQQIFGGTCETTGPCAFLADQYIPQNTHLTAGFTQPAVNSTVDVSCTDTSWMSQAPTPAYVAVGGGGFYSAAILTSTTARLTNLGNAENASVGASVPSGANFGRACSFLTAYITGFDANCPPLAQTFSNQLVSGAKTAVSVGSLTGYRPGLPIVVANVDGTLRETNWIASINYSSKTVTPRNNWTNNHNTLSSGVYGLISPTYLGFDISGFNNFITMTNGALAGGQSNVPGNVTRISDVNATQVDSCLSLIGVSSMGITGSVVDNATMNRIVAGITGGTFGASNADQFLNNGRIGIDISTYQGSAINSGFHPIGLVSGVDSIKPGPNNITAINSGGMRVSTRTVTTATDTVQGTDYVVYFNRAGAITETMPSVVGMAGRIFKFQDISGAAGTNNITLKYAVADGGATIYVINANNGAIEMTSDGLAWYIS